MLLVGTVLAYKNIDYCMNEKEGVSVKKLTYLSGLVALFFSPLLLANTLVHPSEWEPNLMGSGGILDNEFGLDHLLRIDDKFDQYWHVTANEVSVTTVASHAGLSQNFGFIDGDDNYTSLLYVPFANAQTGTFTLAESGSPFRFGLDPDGSPLFSSNPDDNVTCSWFFCSGSYDHMVSWLITEGEFVGDYVLAWEDLTKLGDRDYNDLVVRVSGVSAVPVPAALWLFTSGLLGLFTVLKRRP